MSKITHEKLDSLRERNYILTQEEYERIFKGTVMGTLKVDQVWEFLQYVVSGPFFNMESLCWVKGKKDRYLKTTIDLDNGYIKRSVYLGDDCCFPACYAPAWKSFKEAKAVQPIEENEVQISTPTAVEVF